MTRSKIILAIVLALTSFSFSLSAQKDKRQERERTLIGKVLNQQEEPVVKAVVSLKNTRTQVTKSFITGPDGAFHFGYLSPNIDYEVRAQWNDASSDTKIVSSLDPRQRIEVTLRLK